MYKIGNVVSSDVGSLANYFRALGDFTEKEIHVAELDFYLTQHGLSMPYESSLVFDNSTTSSFPSYFFKPVFVVQDPRIDALFGIHHIPNKIVIRKEERSYSTVQASEEGLTFRMYRLNKLRRVAVTSPLSLAIQSDTYYNPNTKMKPFVITRHDVKTGVVMFDYSFDGLRKSEYNHYTFLGDTDEMVTETRRIFDKESYTVSTNVKQYGKVLDLIDAMPHLDFLTLHAGQPQLYF
jgi:hypothetical protein